METVDTSITPELFEQLKVSEAAYIKHMENANGDHWCEVAAVGTLEEMQELLDTPRLIIVPTGMDISYSVVPVAELEMP